MDTTYLPIINDFVTVAVPGESTRSIAVDAVSMRIIRTRALEGVAIGTQATFDYHNGHGHFRFTTQCCEADQRSNTFSVPPEIRTIERFSQDVSSFDVIVDAKWRYAPGGKGYGSFVSEKLLSLNSGGAIFMLPRNLRPGTLFEMQIWLDGSHTCRRIAKLLATQKLDSKTPFGKPTFRADVAFVDTTDADDLVIAKFIAGRQADARDRSFAL